MYLITVSHNVILGFD